MLAQGKRVETDDPKILFGGWLVKGEFASQDAPIFGQN